MRKFLVFLLAAVSVGFTLERVSYLDGDGLVRYAVETKTRDPLKMREFVGRLANDGFDVAGLNWHDGTIEVITDAEGVRRLASRGLTGFSRDRHSFARLDPRYLNPQKVEDALKALNQKYPAITRLEKIGTSLEGRAIWALLISNTAAANDARALEKPTVIFDGMHHAREIMTPEVVLDVAETLLAGAGSAGNSLQGAMDRWNIWVVPMLNVDGNNVVWTKNSYWRKNAHADQNERVFGVDLNRNYPFMWNGCNGSSSNPSSDTYRGATPASEPETQAIVALAQATRPAASLSYHSFSEFVLYPFGCGDLRSSENKLLAAIGKEMADLLPSDSNDGSTYVAETPWKLLYSADGESMSYLHSEFGTTAFGFEINQEFQPDYALREPTLVKHRKAWKYFLERIDRNLLTIKVTNAGAPAQAAIEIDTIQHQHGEKPFRTNAAGAFFKILDPGHYVVRATLADGRKAEAAIDMQGQPQVLELKLTE